MSAQKPAAGSEILSPELSIASDTQASERHPKRNEDSLLVKELPGGIKVIGVFDGIGGEFGGEVASQAAKTSVEKSVTRAQNKLIDISKEMAEKHIEAWMRDANRAVIESEGEGTTATIALINENTGNVVVGHAGDSRMYILRQRELIHVTYDQIAGYTTTAYAHIIEEYGGVAVLQKILATQETFEPYSKLESIHKAPTFVALTNHLGMPSKEFEPEIITGQLHRGDIMLIASDGITDVLDDSKIIEVLEKNKYNTLDTAKALIAEAANRNTNQHPRAKPDDKTAIVVCYNGNN